MNGQSNREIASSGLECSLVNLSVLEVGLGEGLWVS